MTAVALAEVLREGVAYRGPWWTPKRSAVRTFGRWVNLHNQYTPNVKDGQTLNVSPVDAKGRCRVLVWDVDTGEEGDVRRLLSALPEGCCPLVSFSGMKGWHVWVFPESPVSVRQARTFGEDVRERSGVECEFFPSSEKSRLIKWPGSLHPETGMREAFVSPDALNDTETLDTALVLELLSEGKYRTPVEVLTGCEERECDSILPSPLQNLSSGSRGGDYIHQLFPGGIIVESLEVLTRSEAVIDGLMGLAGRRPVRLGKGFRCILHSDKKPSASFCRGENGTIVYHDWHASKHGTPEFLLLGEVYHALCTGEVRKLKPHEAGRWFAKLALRLGYRTPLALEVEASIETAEAKLEASLLHPLQTPSYGSCGGSCGGIIFTTLFPDPEGDENRDSEEDSAVIQRVWRVFCSEALIRAMYGLEGVNASARWLSERAQAPLKVANRAVNLLCALGILSKVPGTGGMRGDRFVFGDADISEVKRRWEALGKPSLRRFNRTLVIERLGEDVANAVFRRTPDGRLIRPETVTSSEIMCDHAASEGIPASFEDIPRSFKDIPKPSVTIPPTVERVLNGFGMGLETVWEGFVPIPAMGSP
ncbi:MAG TPA: hypothetical protein GX507_11240 [Clostridia bacterium]|nr:hypothetical protein [Clostridia bacterium]